MFCCLASIPQFNGNISSVSWKSEYYDDLKQYQFEYDALNRLIEADYASNAAYSTSYAYDKNGNINNLSRNGKVDNIVGAIDSLYYAYNGNQLTRVTDFATGDYNLFGFNENGETNTIDYDYDANGNMKWDKNKGITDISYNHLNLPTQINIVRDENKQVKYIYTATGSKLRKQTLGNAAENITTDYVGAFVYETTDDLELQFIQTSEGRLVPNDNGGFDYEYALKDHLGNTRVMFNEAGEVLQDQSYYPFGMAFGSELTFNSSQTLENKYLYNGKELQTDFDLGWYDYGARFFDPSLGRFMVQDKYAEVYYPFSPYSYCAGNPIKNVDVNGEFIGTIIGTVVGAVAGAYDSHKSGGDMWAGAAEGAVSGAIAGAAVDLVVAATVATGGGALVVIGAGAAAGAVGGAAGAVAGDATGQVVTNMRIEGDSFTEAVSNVNADKMLDKAIDGAVSGAVGGALGGGVAKVGNNLLKGASNKLVNNAEDVAKTIRKNGVLEGASQEVINENVNNTVNAMGKSVANTRQAVSKTGNQIGAGTESGIKVVQQNKKE